MSTRQSGWLRVLRTREWADLAMSKVQGEKKKQNSSKTNESLKFIVNTPKGQVCMPGTLEAKPGMRLRIEGSVGGGGGPCICVRKQAGPRAWRQGLTILPGHCLQYENFLQ